jgi:hypothetical protein
MKRFVLASCIVVVLLGGIVSYVQLGPIRTLLSIQKSFRVGDMELLDNSIDFEAVRKSIKLQIRSYINRQDSIQSENPLLQTLYSSFSYSFIDSMVKEYLQPKAIQSLFDFSGRTTDAALTDGNQGKLLTEDNSGVNWLALAREYQALCDFEYRSWSEFELSLKESITKPISLALFAGTRIRFQRNGIDWKLNDIIFPESFFESKLR